eukprot:TRINITY_DN46819_c0_g1_i1.p1 TRINITY_DN46819_c0_g1~~TRINITY_DN46819_c0_g1_i1.p1  ORF type:complete len:417 (-),score=50.03 TRINITY_DN46819_c0_g1_i1:38-1228(-)
MDILKARPDDETTFLPKAAGSFNRGACRLQNWIEDSPEAFFSPKPGRYHVFLNYGCGWSHQVRMLLALRKLDSPGGVSITHVACYRGPGRGTPDYKGWIIPDAAQTDTSGYAFDCMRDAYNKARMVPGPDADAVDGEYYGVTQLTIPVLFDKETGAVVSNDPAQILLMLDFQAERLSSSTEATRRSPQLYPCGGEGVDEERIRSKIEEINAVVYPGINNGVYCCWFSSGKVGDPAFDEGFELVQNGLQYVEGLLEESAAAMQGAPMQLGPFLVPGTAHPTMADVRAFPHLFRFDGIYWELMLRCQGKRIFEAENFPRLRKWLSETMFGMPEVRRSCDLQVATRFYFSSLPVAESDAIYEKRRAEAKMESWLPSLAEWAQKRDAEGVLDSQIQIVKF